MLQDMLLEMCWVSELFVAVGAGEPGLFLMDQKMVFKAVLPGEGGLALVTLNGLLL